MELSTKEILGRVSNVIRSDSPEALANALGTTAQNIGHWKNRNKRVPVENLFGWAQDNNISMDWLLAGRGDVYLNTEAEYRTIPKAAIDRWPLLGAIVASARAMDEVMIIAACNRLAYVR
jgi:hypothetical protein